MLDKRTRPSVEPATGVASPARPTVKSLPSITPGVADAAMSSLATFVAALVAAAVLDGAELGVYAVFYTAFNFGQVVANNLVYIPAEVTAVAWPSRVRLRLLEQSLPLAMGPTLAGTLSIAVAGFVAIQMAPASLVVPLTLTAAATTYLWPTQDHVRRTLHIADRSWTAATVSAVQLVTVGASLGVLLIVDVPVAWIPFGALALGNCLSLLVGLVAVRWTQAPDPAPERLELRKLTHSGVSLLIGVGTPSIAAFAAATIIAFVAGTEILGFAEAARIAAQPVFVLGTGLGYVLGPRVMRGAIAGDVAVSRRNHMRFNAMVGSVAIGYTLLAGWKWPGNPMAALLPEAFEIGWLVPATIAANVLTAALILVLQELMAARRARVIAAVALIAAPLQLAAAATAGVTQAFARPLSQAVGSGVSLFGSARSISALYAQAPSQQPIPGPR